MTIWKKLLLRIRERYLFSFLMILLLPCAVMAVFVQSTYIRQMDEYILSAAREDAQRAVEEFDRIFEEMDTIHDIVALDVELGEPLSPREYSKVMEIQTLLKTLLVNQKGISNILVYQEGSDYLISAKGTYQRSIFCSVYNPGGMTEEAFYRSLREGTPGQVTAQSSQGEYWLYVTHFSQKRQNCHLLFLLDKAELRQILSKHLTDGVGVVYIQNSREDVLAWQTNDPDYSQVEYEALADQLLRGREKAIMAKGGYVLAHPAATLLQLVIFLGEAAVALLVPGLFPLIPAFGALLKSYSLERVFRKYLPEEENDNGGQDYGV